VAVVVEVADQRHLDAHPQQALTDARHGLGRLVAVDRDAHDLGTGAGEVGGLPCGRLHVGRVRVGHRLYDDRRAAADDHAAHIDGDGYSALCQLGHSSIAVVNGVASYYRSIVTGG
jgi:hypothetical protein